jgi:glycine cleavage system aminomethyltransferase T
MGFQIGDKSKIASSDAKVLINGKVVGRVTSAALSVTYDFSFGMAFIDTEYAKKGTKVQIAFADDMVDAILINKTLHDPEGKRLTV